jgi:hypothetical protein
MNIPNITPLTIPQTPDLGLTLRLNQRIAAEILQVASEHVVLVLNGQKIVAKLTAPEHAAILMQRKTAEFIVKQLDQKQVHLQLVPKLPAPPPETPILDPVIIHTVLKEIGLPEEEPFIQLARALILKNVPVTPENITQLQQGLPQVEEWSEEQIKAAIKLLTAGLPISDETVEILVQVPESLPDQIEKIEQLLRNLSQRSLKPVSRKWVQRGLQTIFEAIPNWKSDPEILADSLKKSIALWGKSVEKQIAEIISQHHERRIPRRYLSAFLHLHRAMKFEGQKQAVMEIEHFLDSMRFQHVRNAPAAHQTEEQPWIDLELPLLIPGHPNTKPDIRGFSLRIAAKAHKKKVEVDSEDTRLTLRVDLLSGQSIAVDLSIAGKRIATDVTTTNDNLHQMARDELPDLVNCLTRLGYEVHSADCTLQKIPTSRASEHSAKPLSANEIDLEI